MCVCVKLENPSIISHNNNSIYIYSSNRSSFLWYNWLDNSNDHLLVAFVQFLPCLLAAASQKNKKNASEPVENSPCGYVRMYIYFQCCYHHHQVKHDEMIFTVDFLLIASSHHYHPYTQVNSVKSVSLYHTFTYLETCKYASTLYVDFFSTCTASSSFLHLHAHFPGDRVKMAEGEYQQRTCMCDGYVYNMYLCLNDIAKWHASPLPSSSLWSSYKHDLCEDDDDHARFMKFSSSQVKSKSKVGFKSALMVVGF